MSDPTAEFFESLGRREHEPLLEKCSGAVRFDLTAKSGTDYWLVRLDNGEVSVSQENREADCVIRADKSVFKGMASGEMNGMTAYLRGLISLEGDPELLVLFQRVFPAPRRRDAQRAVRGSEQR
jgi:putative sterol carrier protein